MVLRVQFCILASCLFESNEEKFSFRSVNKSVRRFAVIQEEMCCKALRRFSDIRMKIGWI